MHRHTSTRCNASWSRCVHSRFSVFYLCLQGSYEQCPLAYCPLAPRHASSWSACLHHPFCRPAFVGISARTLAGQVLVIGVYRLGRDLGDYSPLCWFVDGRPKNAIAVCHAWLSFFRNVFKTAKKRKTYPAKPNRTGLYRKSIVFGFFAKKRRTFSDLKTSDFCRQSPF